MTTEKPSVDTVRELSERYRNWGRWGDDDERGTLNHATPERVAAAAASIRSGKRISMALPMDATGPQVAGGFGGRFNPIHLMFRDGGDIEMGTVIDEFYGGRDRHLRGTDDIIIMALQSSTQWDALAHIFFDGHMYNGRTPDQVTSKGARFGSVANATDQMAGRGVLLDIAHLKGVDALEPGYAITAEDLEAAEAAHGVTVGEGDFVMIRTGMVGERRGDWGDYAGGPAPGLGLESVPWVAERNIAGLAVDTWGMEVLPNQTEDVFQPLHCVFIVAMGLWVGEIFDFEELAADCREDGQYDFFFCAPPLPFTRAVGSPVNPMAIK
ncbi:cyclase family protein [Homoserinibacter sp. YIM 151385]|uniref:cyclase family protein n=1 Tax=Homoserinibacter sp. YIM 151385 TaxID=2985506 RepID=UPI0022F1301F|nr:cyclase family protein [Homoserinibacter sp. YIM 151385]WBU37102.1 cyclase family protein [Homoserinibacter sp. YIM 151385]